ncbi:MAG TPA: hypothetical protein QGG18_08570 [Rhodospirillales bacterium]|nr:hypothetical protein [Rhodospirillales bacterium]
MTVTTGRWAVGISVALNGSSIVALLTLSSKIFPRTANTGEMYDGLHCAMELFFIGVVAAIISIGAGYFGNLSQVRNTFREAEAIFGPPWEKNKWVVRIEWFLTGLSIGGGVVAYMFFLFGAWKSINLL